MERRLLLQGTRGYSINEYLLRDFPSDVFILVKGHTRATAYVVSEYGQPIDCLVGTSAHMS
jgi:hypothetical protein